MDSKLLQKIEELTLYVIQQNKKLHHQNQKIKDLREENKNYNKKLLELQSRLKKLEK